MLKKKERYNVAVMGATGAVGGVLLSVLEERGFPIADLRLLASERSKGKKMVFSGKEHEVEVLTESSFEDVDIVLASAGASRSKEFLPHAVRAGAVCVDNSSAFRMDEDVPLVVPEVNREDIGEHEGIIANPNCSTIQMVVPLHIIAREAGIRRVVVSTYQSVSGAGGANILELAEQVRELLAKNEHYLPRRHDVSGESVKNFPHQIAFNALCHIDVFQDNLYTKEEMKMVDETRKILHLPELPVTATCVRVPVYYAHSESVNVETEKKLSRERAIELFKASSAIEVLDDPSELRYPTPLDAEGRDAIFIGRVREDISVRSGLNLWVVADNLRKGAALNAVQIAECLIDA